MDCPFVKDWEEKKTLWRGKRMIVKAWYDNNHFNKNKHFKTYPFSKLKKNDVLGEKINK